jgi:hypothetical protein
MTTLVISNGVMTFREKNQSIKKHIEQHEKDVWISEFMRISGYSYQIALQNWKLVFEK